MLSSRKLSALRSLCSQVGSLLKLCRDTASKVGACVALVPRVVDYRNLTADVLDHLNEIEFGYFEKAIGPSFFNFVPHNATGHYELQFSHPVERIIIRHLAELAQEQKIERQASPPAHPPTHPTPHTRSWHDATIIRLYALMLRGGPTPRHCRLNLPALALLHRPRP